jgi:hypothetical protein
VLVLKVVVLDAEFNSASNDDTFKGWSSGKKWDLGTKYSAFGHFMVTTRIY